MRFARARLEVVYSGGTREGGNPYIPKKPFEEV